MLKAKLVALTLGSVVLVLSSQVNADPISFAGTGLTSAVTVKHNGSDLSVLAGEILVDYNSARFTAYCVDLDQPIKSSWDTTVAPVSTVNGGLAAAYLYDHFAGSVPHAAQAARLQIPIWAVVGDFGSTFSLLNGSFGFSGSSGIIAAAQSYLRTLPADLSSYSTTACILRSGESPRSQNLIVPEPASLILLASILPTMLLGRRR